MFGALSRLVIIHISCDSAEKEKEANIASIQLNDPAVFVISLTLWSDLSTSFRFVCVLFKLTMNSRWFFSLQWLIAPKHGSFDINGYKDKYSLSRNSKLKMCYWKLKLTFSRITQLRDGCCVKTVLQVFTIVAKRFIVLAVCQKLCAPKYPF